MSPPNSSRSAIADTMRPSGPLVLTASLRVDRPQSPPATRRAPTPLEERIAELERMLAAMPASGDPVRGPALSPDTDRSVGMESDGPPVAAAHTDPPSSGVDGPDLAADAGSSDLWPSSSRPRPILRAVPDPIEDAEVIQPDVNPSGPATASPQSEEISVLDEAYLREILAEVVREQLEGDLGERITRNLRRMIRRELRAALTAHGDTGT